MAVLETYTDIDKKDLEAGELHEKINENGCVVNVSIEHDPTTKILIIHGDSIIDLTLLNDTVTAHISPDPLAIPTEEYIGRSKGREKHLHRSTLEMVGYFMQTLGDSEEDANAKVTELSTELAPALFPYVLGNKQPLLDGINASALPYMDANAKVFIINSLNYTLNA